MSADATRIDKWLWYARFFKSRSRATDFCEGRGIRVNGTLVGKAQYLVRPGDVLTFPVGHNVRVIRIVELGGRRGPAPEAQALYEDLSPPPLRRDGGGPPPSAAMAPARDAGSGRPTKAERRATDRLRDRS